MAAGSRMDPTSKLQSCLASFDAGATPESVYGLAYLLSHVVGEDEAAMLRSLGEAPRAIPQAIALARSTAAEGDVAVMKDLLSALANLACIGGVSLVKQQGGFELMLEQLRAEQVSVMYYALAGVQNMAGDLECHQQLLATESDRVLEALLEHPRDSIRRLATGALVNISELSAVQEAEGEGEEEEEGEEGSTCTPVKKEPWVRPAPTPSPYAQAPPRSVVRKGKPAEGEG